MKKFFLFLCLCCVGIPVLHARDLQPGFDREEFIEMLKIAAQTSGFPMYDSFPRPQKYQSVYQSEPVGFDNVWQLWISDDSVAVISIRGTVQTKTSFLANLYAVMVPAKGQLHLSDDFIFDYQLSNDPKAAVHTGYLIATAFLSRDILPKIDSCYRRGIHSYIIAGHSQGGGITYLMTAYLYHLQAIGRLPSDIRFKTYASAAPKPGNLFFAYSFETLTRGGWAFNVVNPEDWVPETPFTIQTVTDFSTTNPFLQLKPLIKEQSFPKNLILRHIYNRLRKPPEKARAAYQQYLGTVLTKYVRQVLPGYQTPEFFKSSHYVRTGETIVLPADADYLKNFPNGSENVWEHHSFYAYLYLIRHLPTGS